MIPRPQRRRKPPGPPSVYEAETQGVTVRVTPDYLPHQSDPVRGAYVWAYQVEIENRGLREIQLVSRHWIITDGLNRTEEVNGPGVVGEQPSLKPGEAYRYVSACPLTTTSGLMHGAYRMLTPDGDCFDVAIPTFSLDLPLAGKRLN